MVNRLVITAIQPDSAGIVSVSFNGDVIIYDKSFLGDGCITIIQEYSPMAVGKGDPVPMYLKLIIAVIQFYSGCRISCCLNNIVCNYLPGYSTL